jgi:hypothetical protein
VAVRQYAAVLQCAAVRAAVCDDSQSNIHSLRSSMLVAVCGGLCERQCMVVQVTVCGSAALCGNLRQCYAACTPVCEECAGSVCVFVLNNIYIRLNLI